MSTILIAASGLLALVACAGPAVEPTWIMVIESGPAEEGFITYADTASIRKSGNNTVRMVSMIDSAVADDVARDRHFVSWKDTWEYDCQNKMQRPRQYTEYSGRMGTGQQMFNQRVPTFVWLNVPPESVGEKLWQIACGQQ